jgi:DNA primase
VLIPESKIQEVRERVDLVALIQKHGIELKKSGRSHRGLCPFHQEKSPSFHVWAEERRFKCFGCQVGGDAISFSQRLTGKNFVETVRDLAKDAGIDIEASVDPSMREKAEIKDATDTAARHFQSLLWDPSIGRQARDYLRSRGLTEETIRAFGLGWAPSEWTSLVDDLKKHGLVSAGEKAGLVAARQQREGHYDVFRGRVMIPIRSPEGRTIAFGGRLLEGADAPKYLNSRENRLYVKSDILYGADMAKDEIRRRKSVTICEGYFDCIGLYQAGITSAVALCSTALTPGHLALLHRLEAKDLVLLLDGDEAGRKAVERLAGAIFASGFPTRVAVLPSGEDPDTYARKVGTDAVRQLLHDAPGLTAHILDSALPNKGASTFEEKMGALEQLRPVFAQIPPGLRRSALLASVSKQFGLPAAELETTFMARAATANRDDSKKPPKQATPPVDNLEASYVAAVLRNRDLFALDQLHVSDEFQHMELRMLVAEYHSGSTHADVLYESSDGVKAAVQSARETLPSDPSALELAFRTVCRRLKLRAIDRRLQLIATAMATTPGSSMDLTQMSRDLLDERGRLLTLKRQLQGDK